ncbi:histidine kinase [Leucobacter sp. gxy201]|uniref:sensor histidine kinase n=1 Tax=Leucobacter sp. gxy201 TaxID=2957200 RepID=UPI003DA02FA3
MISTVDGAAAPTGVAHTAPPPGIPEQAQAPTTASDPQVAPSPEEAQASTGQSAAPAQKAAAPNAREARPPLRILLTILQLAAYGLVGFATIGMLFGVLGAGIGMLFLLGLGLVVLVALVYALFGIAWFENRRIAGLYELRVPALRLQQLRAPGFKGWLGAICRQSIDGGMWRAIANFVVASAFGAAVLGLAQWFVHSLFALFTEFDVWWQPGIVGGLFSAAGIVGLALLHRIVSLAIIGSGAKEEELAAQVRTTSEQREGAVRAADLERTRIERDLHDGVQPRLVSVGMTLGLAQQKIDTDPEAAKALVAEAHTSTKAAITELRQLARGIYASVLDDRGLDAALSALAARSHIPVLLDVRLQSRCSRDAEAAVYFSIAESLTNAAKHSRASECRVVVRTRDEGVLWARIEDNGIGGAHAVPGGGIDGVMNRVLAAGGTTRLDSPQGGPTALEVSVPCAS